MSKQNSLHVILKTSIKFICPARFSYLRSLIHQA